TKMMNKKSSQFLLTILGFAALLALSARIARADTAKPATVEYDSLKVVHAWGVNEKNGEPTDESNGLYNTIVVEIENLAKWATQEGIDPAHLILYLVGH